ncbi:MAG: hypothetical protein RL403_888 [Bacteroidota bacterium]|jgi:hypothetical protein
MAKSDEELDRVFREKLENHEASPSSVAWDKLEAQLDAARQPKKSSWWAIAAAMPLLLGLSYLIWSQVPEIEQENSVAVIEEVLEVPFVPESMPESERVFSEDEKEPAYLAEKSTYRSSKPILQSTLPQENTKETQIESRATETVTSPNLEAAVAVELNSAIETKIFLTPESIQTTPSLSSSPPNLAVAEGIDGYRVRIFSDGLKKEDNLNKNLITELGKTVGQVEGLLDKLDEGLVEIQDKKDRFFSSLTSRKTPSIEKQ